MSHASTALPPVPRSAAAPFLNRGLAFQAAIWEELGMRVHSLRTVHRQRDRRFVAILHALREGRHTDAQMREVV